MFLTKSNLGIETNEFTLLFSAHMWLQSASEQFIISRDTAPVVVLNMANEISLNEL
jgi:hypothetical protein